MKWSFFTETHGVWWEVFLACAGKLFSHVMGIFFTCAGNYLSMCWELIWKVLGSLSALTGRRRDNFPCGTGSFSNALSVWHYIIIEMWHHYKFDECTGSRILEFGSYVKFSPRPRPGIEPSTFSSWQQPPSHKRSCALPIRLLSHPNK